MVSHRAAWLRAIAARHRRAARPRRRGVVVMFGLFHMAGWTMIETARRVDRPVHLVHRADPPELLGAVERWGASGLYCIPGVWQRILDDRRHATTRRRWSRHSPARRCVTLDLIDALKERFPGSCTSIAYGSTEIGRGAMLLDSDLYDQPRQRRATATDGHRRSRRRRRALVARAPRCSPATSTDPTPPPRRSTRTAGSTPATSPPATPTATSRSPGAARSRSARAASGWRRSRSRPRSSRIPRSQEVAVVGLPDASWGEVVCAAIVVKPGATLPTVDELRAHVGRGPRRAQATARGRAGRHSSRAPTPPGRSGGDDCATRSSPNTPTAAARLTVRARAGLCAAQRSHNRDATSASVVAGASATRTPSTKWPPRSRSSLPHSCTNVAASGSKLAIPIRSSRRGHSWTSNSARQLVRTLAERSGSNAVVRCVPSTDHSDAAATLGEPIGEQAGEQVGLHDHRGRSHGGFPPARSTSMRGSRAMTSIARPRMSSTAPSAATTSTATTAPMLRNRGAASRTTRSRWCTLAMTIVLPVTLDTGMALGQAVAGLSRPATKPSPRMVASIPGTLPPGRQAPSVIAAPRVSDCAA